MVTLIQTQTKIYEPFNSV